MKLRFKIITFLALLLYCTIASSLYGQVKFQRVLAKNKDVLGSCVLQTPDKGYMLLSNNGYIIVKTDSNGRLVQGKQYAFGSKYYSNILLPTSDGGFYATGEGAVKIAKDESAQWAKVYGYVNNAAMIIDAHQTADGGFILCGKIHNSSTAMDNICLIRTAKTGAILWYKTLVGGSYNDVANSVAITPDGGYVFAGTTVPTLASGKDGDGFILKTDSSGATQWAKRYHSSGGGGFKSIEPAGSGYILAVASNGMSLIYKTDAKGKMLWGKGIDSVYPYKVIKTADGGYLLGGNMGLKGAVTTCFFKTDSNGKEQWAQKYICDLLRSFIQTADGGYMMTGDITYSNQGVYIAKTDASGNIGCALASYSPTLVSDSLTSSSLTFKSTGLKIYDSALSVNINVIPTIPDTTICTVVSAIEAVTIDKSIKVYPNPTTGMIITEAPEIKDGLVTLTNITGQMIMQVKINGKAEMDLRGFAKGVYFLRVQSEDAVEVRKVLKE